MLQEVGFQEQLPTKAYPRTTVCVRVLAADGAVRLGFSSRADDPAQTVTELLQDQSLCHRLRLVITLRLPRLLEETVTGRLGNLLRYERVWQPGREGREGGLEK